MKEKAVANKSGLLSKVERHFKPVDSSAYNQRVTNEYVMEETAEKELAK